MKNLAILALLVLLAGGAWGFSCPSGTTTVVELQTCDNAEKTGNVCNPNSTGFNFMLDGSQDSPQWLWGLLAQDSNWISKFYKLYEINVSGTIIDGSIIELNTFQWTYCNPVQNGNQVSFAAYGVNGNVQISITGSVTDATTTQDFKWSFVLQNYQWFTGVAHDLVLFSKYETEGGDSTETKDGSDSSEVVNADSYITTARTALYNGNSVAVSTSATDNGETGYFIIFHTFGGSNTFNTLELDPTMGVNSAAAAGFISVALLLVAMLAVFL
jgi:hypothetical protein